MEKYWVRLTETERKDLTKLIQKGGKGYRIKHAQILLKLDQNIVNVGWTYERIKESFGVSNGMIAGVAKRFVMEGMEAALGRKKHDNYRRKITGEVEAQICVIACSAPPEGKTRWTMQMIADELVRLEIVDSISDSAVCEAMKKTRLSHGKQSNGAFPKRERNS